MTSWSYRMLLLLICTLLLHFAVHSEANVMLTSTVEVNGRRFACEGEMVTFTCHVVGSITLQWDSPLIFPIIFSASSTVPQISNPFIATLTSIAGIGVNSNFTSTLQVNASRAFARNQTTVECRSQQNVNESSSFKVAAVPAVPLNATVNQVERVSGGGSATITASWIRPPNFELFDIDCYNINVSSTSGVQHLTTACGVCTNTTVTVAENPSNVQPSTTFTITISARSRCNETSPTATATYALTDCGALPLPVNGFLLPPYTNTTEGSLAVFQCDSGFVPEGVMTAVCESDGQWTPNSGNVTCSPRPTPTSTQTTQTSTPTQTPIPTSSSNEAGKICTTCPTSVAITAVVSCAVSFTIGALVGAVVLYCTVRKKSNCQKCYSLTIAHKQQQQQQQQPAPVYEDIVGQSQNIELKENVAYGPVQQ